MSDGEGANAEPDSEIEIDALLQEGRRFAPSEAFREKAHLKDTSLYDEADKDYEAFWARMAGELEWIEPWKEVLSWNPPHAKWFVGGKLNVSANCLDRHVAHRERDRPPQQSGDRPPQQSCAHLGR